MAMFARVTSVALEGDIDQAIALIRDRIVPQASRLEGIVAAYWLGNRNTRRGLAVTVWENEEAMLASADVARGAARRERQEADVDTTAVEHYEVVAHL